MPTLTIKKVPKALYEKLRERAEQHRRSMNSEALACLEQILLPAPRDADALIFEAEGLNARTKVQFSDDLIERGKRQGRA